MADVRYPREICTKKSVKYSVDQIAGTAIGCAFSGNIFRMYTICLLIYNAKRIQFRFHNVIFRVPSIWPMRFFAKIFAQISLGYRISTIVYEKITPAVFWSGWNTFFRFSIKNNQKITGIVCPLISGSEIFLRDKRSILKLVMGKFYFGKLNSF